jgi:glycogen operon protein
MASTVWKGYLTFGLISVPINLYAAARREHVSFHMVHQPCGTRVKQQLFCPHCERVVERSEIVKGYEESKDAIIEIDPEELKKIAPPSERNMDILQFVKLEEVDPVYFDASYYALPSDNGHAYCDYTGVGNTMRCNNAPVKRLIIDSLRYWVEEMHVDGYRFDLAPALGAKDLEFDNCPTSSDKNGKSGIQWDPHGTIVQEIVDDPILRKHNTRIIAEPWGAGGYPVGQFPASSVGDGYGWGEWNNRFRDWWRSFVNDDTWLLNRQQDGADGGYVIAGSEPMFRPNGRHPYHSINFITCHDGMTMYDLVSYNQKVNDCSPLNPVCCTSPMSSFCQEAKNSGTDDNRSRNWIGGGECGDPNVDTDNCGWGWACVQGHCVQTGEAFKRQLMRNWFVAMMISNGTPMIFGGDEWLRTQLGNNNTYTPEADNAYSWHDWGAWQANDERWRMYDFVSKAIAFRKANAAALAPVDYGQRSPFSWKTFENRDASGTDWEHRSLMIHYYDSSRGPQLAILINMEADALNFQLPGGKSWHRVLDTQAAFDQPSYLVEKGIPLRTSGNIDLGAGETVPGSTYRVQSRTIVVLEAQ